MSYSRCFICEKDNFSGNETRVTVERKTVDKETMTQRTEVWIAHVCDECLHEYFGVLGGEVFD